MINLYDSNGLLSELRSYDSRVIKVRFASDYNFDMDDPALYSHGLAVMLDDGRRQGFYVSSDGVVTTKDIEFLRSKALQWLKEL